MLLCLDIGNTHIHGGVFSQGEEPCLQFRYPSAGPLTSDVFGLFIAGVLREHHFDPNEIEAVSMSSVVPSIDYTIKSACKKYFDLIPLEIKPGIKTGLNIRVKQPAKVGADRIATATAAVESYPDRDIIVIDFGTATTVCAITKNKDYLGGAILPGMQTSQQALCSAAAQLMPVSIVKPDSALGLTTESNIQSGLYYGQLGGVRCIIDAYQRDIFGGIRPCVVATGGYAYLFENESLYDRVDPYMVLRGLKYIWEKNQGRHSA
jgi:type III pantothenate kinase